MIAFYTGTPSHCVLVSPPQPHSDGLLMDFWASQWLPVKRGGGLLVLTGGF